MQALEDKRLNYKLDELELSDEEIDMLKLTPGADVDFDELKREIAYNFLKPDEKEVLR